ncbi:MAG: electron transport complex subunit RsxC [Chromatiaceae bacterium]
MDSALYSYRLGAGQRQLWTFPGGLHLPDEKELSNSVPLVSAPLSRRLIIPLRQHIGAPAKPLVAVGDRVLKGQLIGEAQGTLSATIHASSSGTVIALEERPVPHASGLSAPCILIETDGEDAWAELPPPLSARPDPTALRERIRWAGIVGLGGATFPSSVKLTPAPGIRIRTLIVNGAECEPYISCDDRLMRDKPERILQGARLLRDLLGVDECLIAVEDNKPEAVTALRQSLKSAGDAAAIEIIAIPTLYPSGGEKQLIRILTGQEVPSREIPVQIGIVCQNIATVAAIADAAFDGKPLISRIVTLTGRGVGQPRNLEVPIGVPIRDFIEQAGGLSPKMGRLLIGGPMMGFACDDLDVPVTKAVNCLLALSPEEAPDPGPVLACIRCGACAQACPVSLLPQQLYWHARARDLDKVRDYNLFDCIECGCCAVVCPSHIPLVQYYRFAKNECLARDQEKRQAELARQRHEAKEARLERLEQERKANLRKKKEGLADKPTPSPPGPTEAGARPPDTATQDPKKAAIAAALKRAAEKKAALASQGLAPKNTENLAPAQQRQVEAAEVRRRELQAAEDAARPRE